VLICGGIRASRAQMARALDSSGKDDGPGDAGGESGRARSARHLTRKETTPLRPLVRHDQLRTRGTDILLAAARDAGVSRFVAQSYIGWTNPRVGGPVKRESDGLDPDPPPQQWEALAAIRHLEETVPAAPLEGIVLRYGNFYGPGASEDLVELIRKRRFPLVGDGAGVWSWMHLDDAAGATVAAHPDADKSRRHRSDLGAGS
jgi:nucleoside-diphosphate-sugar epimerase